MMDLAPNIVQDAAQPDETHRDRNSWELLSYFRIRQRYQYGLSFFSHSNSVPRTGAHLVFLFH